MPGIFGRIKLPFWGDKSPATIFGTQISAATVVNEIPFPTIFYHLNFQLPHPNRSNNVSSHKYPLKDHKTI